MTAGLYLVGLYLAIVATVVLGVVRAGPSVRPADLSVLSAVAVGACFALALVVLFMS